MAGFFNGLIANTVGQVTGASAAPIANVQYPSTTPTPTAANPTPPTDPVPYGSYGSFRPQAGTKQSDYEYTDPMSGVWTRMNENQPYPNSLTLRLNGNILPSSNGHVPSPDDMVGNVPQLPGLVGTASPGSAVPPVAVPSIQPGSTQPTAAQTTLTPDMTTSGQFQRLTAAGSPIITQAINQSDQGWNARGLLNSSMAVQAGQQAGYNAALPIAQQDASANLNVGTTNTQQQNTMLNANASNATSMANTASNNATSLANTAATLENNRVIGALDRENKIQLTNLTNSNQALLNTNSQAASTYNQTMTNIANIQNNKDFDGTTKQSLVDQQLASLRQFMTQLTAVSGTGNSSIGALNLGSLWDTTTNPSISPPGLAATASPDYSAGNYSASNYGI